MEFSLIVILYIFSIGLAVRHLSAGSGKVSFWSGLLFSISLVLISFLEIKEEIVLFLWCGFLCIDWGHLHYLPTIKAANQIGDKREISKLELTFLAWAIALSVAASLFLIWTDRITFGEMGRVSKVSGYAQLSSLWTSHWVHVSVAGVIAVGVTIISLSLIIRKEEY